MNDAELSRLVDRFLVWPLPKSVNPDPCASMPDHPDRIGTNLLTADEARQMLEYVLAAPPTAPDREKEQASHLRVSFGPDSMVEVDQHGRVSMWSRGEHASRSIGEWMALITGGASSEPRGTFCCPICGVDQPHGHRPLEEYVEKFVRPAFERKMHAMLGSVGGMRKWEAFAQGYYMAFPAEQARKDGGWAERESPTGPYRHPKLQMAWTMFQFAWFEAKGHQVPPPGFIPQQENDND
jgi:hypothetical protein